MGRPRIYTEDRVLTAVRLPASLHERLRRLAAERGESLNALVERAVAGLLAAERSGRRAPG
jgi:predicted HicB family RNase H-like nuclease